MGTVNICWSSTLNIRALRGTKYKLSRYEACSMINYVYTASVCIDIHFPQKYFYAFYSECVSVPSDFVNQIGNANI